MARRFANLIGGEWTEGASTKPNRNPSDVTDVIGEYAQADAAQTLAAIAAARQAFPAWSTGSIQQRFDILDKAGTEILARKDELGALLSREEGKTLPEGVGEAARAGYIFKFFAGETLRLAGERVPSVRPGVDVEITREPIGVVGLIAPWNFPIAIPAWKIAPALAYGNTVVMKPADLVPGCSWAIADILARAGLPAGVFNLVMGRGSVVGEAIIASPDVAGVSFTGSVATGRAIAAKLVARMAKVQLEMGGKNPLVVLDDADLGVAVNAAVQGSYYSTGQRCTASSRLIVTQGIHDRFVRALSERMATLKVDDALAPGTDIGPVVDESQLAQDLEYVGIGKAEGAKLAAGGERLSRAKDGYYFAPGAVHRDDQRHAHRARGDLRSRRRGDPREGLRRGARARERHRVRPLLRRRDDLAQARLALPSPRAGRDGDGESPHGGRRLPRALRRPQGLELRSARAGTLCRRVLHDREDHLHRALTERVPSARTDRERHGRPFNRRRRAE